MSQKSLFPLLMHMNLFFPFFYECECMFLIYICGCVFQMVSNLFIKHAEMLNQQKGAMNRNSTVTRRYQPSTVAAKFQQSLQELLDKMERSCTLINTKRCTILHMDISTYTYIHIFVSPDYVSLAEFIQLYLLFFSLFSGATLFLCAA